MDFDLGRSLEILDRTPRVLRVLLSNLSDDWILNNEGGETWSPFDVMGHLVHGEKTDWPARVKKIVVEGEDPHFEKFDRFAQFNESKGKTLNDLLDEFEELRKKNLELLRSFRITDEMLGRTGIHPAFGTVTLRQLLSTWVAHDLGHTGQIVRVMARQYAAEVGPWKEYLSVMTR